MGETGNISWRSMVHNSVYLVGASNKSQPSPESNLPMKISFSRRLAMRKELDKSAKKSVLQTENNLNHVVILFLQILKKL